MKSLLLILLPLSSLAQPFAEPSIGLTGRLYTMAAIDAGYQFNRLEVAGLAAYEFGVKMPTYGIRGGYSFDAGYYNPSKITIQAGVGHTINQSGKLEGGNFTAPIIGINYLDLQSLVSVMLRYVGGTFTFSFGVKL